MTYTRHLKHGNVLTECGSGHRHRSKAEARRCDALALMEKAHIIHSLEQQPKFPCVVNGVKVCTYVADFSYQDEGGRKVIEDVKGHKTQLYTLKKKLVEALYPFVKISEVSAR